VLAKLAKNVDEAKWLRFISSPEGSSTFKKLSEIETVTYADVLQMFPSARLPLDILMAEVEPIKPRHYSIASAQSFVGDSVHLLIVTVDWKTPGGSPRFGQCTRYLASLKVGQQVTVSLKPSVMKLPPFTTQPIVMSGLGTGAAPFRAYLQARAVQKKQGQKIGPLIYIFGSRYRHAEYLYGEELEAYERDGIVKVLTAFSRDQKNKIYIQHRIQQNQEEILDLLMPPEGSGEEKQGLFTLCGPTDPLPDVQEALIGGFMAKTGKSHQDGEAWLESLKENERAVYEVY
jgi:sulfite reductase (NADPH) flavoprotein alpha-component